jgi:hypothetical protein
VRELRLETIVDALLPVVVEVELGTKTSPNLRALIDLAKRELHKGKA